MDHKKFIFAYFDTPRNKDNAAFQGTEFSLLWKQMEIVERAIGLRPSFHDLSGITYLIQELNLPEHYRSHQSAYCKKVKSSPLFAECLRCKYVTNFLARKRKHGFSGCCHAGVWDFVFPAFLEGVFLGSIFLGSARNLGSTHKPLHRRSYSALPEAPDPKSANLEEIAKTISELINCCLRSHGISADFLRSTSRREGRSNTAPVHWLIQAVVSRVQERFAEPLSLSMLGKELKVRPQYLSRLFSETQGTSLTHFIHCVRVSRAKQLLLAGRFNVTEVATRVGFDDPSYFTRVFHKVEGRLPSEFLSAKV